MHAQLQLQQLNYTTVQRKEGGGGGLFALTRMTKGLKPPRPSHPYPPHTLNYPSVLIVHGMTAQDEAFIQSIDYRTQLLHLILKGPWWDEEHGQGGRHGKQLLPRCG